MSQLDDKIHFYCECAHTYVDSTEISTVVANESPEDISVQAEVKRN